MKVKKILTIDVDLSFFDAEIINCDNKDELDYKIANSEVIEIKEDGKVYNVNSSYILSYEL